MTIIVSYEPSGVLAPPHKGAPCKAKAENCEYARFRDLDGSVAADDLDIDARYFTALAITCQQIDVVKPVYIGIEGESSAIEKIHIPGILGEIFGTDQRRVIGAVRFFIGTLTGRIVTDRMICIRVIDRIEELEIRADTGIEIDAHLIAEPVEEQPDRIIEVRVDRLFEVLGRGRRRPR
jgi:hypothetical protein